METTWWLGAGTLTLAAIYAVSPGLALLLLIVVMIRRAIRIEQRRVRHQALAADYVRLLERMVGY